MVSEISIIGGGIGGLCTAIGLQNAGYSPKVYEKVHPLRGVGAGLILGSNAMQALEILGLADKVKEIAKPISRMSVCSHTGKILTDSLMSYFTDRYGFGNYAIHRGELHELLMAELEDACLISGKACAGLSQKEDAIQIQFANGDTEKTDFLIGADGIHSAIRKSLLPSQQIRYSGYTCWRGIVRTDIRPEKVTETWGPEGRFGIVPLSDNRIYFFATKNAPENSSKMRNWGVTELLQNFGKYHEPIPQILENCRDEDLLWNDIIDFAPLEKLAFGNVLLCGDAGHATTPNMGQGAGMAIEDAAVLMNIMKDESNPEIAFQQFEEKRLPRTTRIVNNSWKFGKVGQLTNPLLIGMRNILIRMTPDRVNQKQFDWLYQPNLS